MSVRSPRMAQIEALLADDPDDPFLNYGLAMEYASLGDEATAVSRLIALTQKSEYVPAFLQAGQLLNRLGRIEEACTILRRGMEVARKVGDDHAYSEMNGLLVSIE